MPSYSGTLTSRMGEAYPAPYVAVRLGWRGRFRDLPGLLDSGADQSLIPEVTAQALGLQKIAEVIVEDANGGSQERDVFVADLDFHGFSVTALPVAATDFPVILIGRDVLNDLVAELNGPPLTFTLSR